MASSNIWLFLVFASILLPRAVHADEEWHYAGVNVAKNKMTRQGPGTTGGFASRLAVDSNTDTCSQTGGAFNTRAYWSVFVGGPFKLKGVRIYNQKDFEYRLKNFKIVAFPSGDEIYNDATADKKLYLDDVIDIPVDLSSATQITVEVAPHTDRGTDAGQSILHLCEIQIYSVKHDCDVIETSADLDWMIRAGTGYLSPAEDLFSSGTVLDFSCSPGTTLKGPTSLRCLATGRFNGVPPECIEVCEAPSEIANGKYEDQQPVSDTFPVDTTLTWSCNEGYESQQDKSRTCLETLTWSGEDPVCIEKACQYPDTFTNGVLTHSDGREYSSGDLQIGLAVTVTCDKGFRTEDLSITCNDDGLWDKAPLCSPIQCEKLASVTNGNYEYKEPDDQESKDIYMYGTIATLICEDNFRAIGGELTCAEDGTWTGNTGSCEAICEAPPLDNGRYEGKDTATADEYTVGQSVSPVCNQGYQLDGELSETSDGVKTCMSDSSWDGPIVTCIMVPCEAPLLDNGLYEGKDTATADQYTVGQSVSPVCNQGYQLDKELGDTSDGIRTCMNDSTWDGPILKCIMVTCEAPLLDNGLYEGKDTTTADQYTVGQSVSPVCNQGYQLDKELGDTSDGIRTCMNDSTWDGPILKCIMVTCEAPLLDNGSYQGKDTTTADQYTPGQSVLPVCNQGYKLDGELGETSDGVRACMNDSTWDGPILTCIMVTCEAPLLDNGSYQGKDTAIADQYTVGQSVSPVCNQGYQLDKELGDTSDGIRTCMNDSTWDGPILKCIMVTCEAPLLDNGSYQGKDTATADKYTPGQSISPVCNQGYKLDGELGETSDGVRACMNDSTWDGPILTCIMVTCEAPLLDNGSYQGKDTAIADQYTVGQSVSPVCNQGYQLDGELGDTSDGIRTCMNDSTWDGTILKCIMVTCEAPLLDNGSYQGKDTATADQYTPGQSISLVCNQGYKLDGELGETSDGVRACMNDSTWDGPILTCITVTCEAPLLDNGSYQGKDTAIADQYTVGQSVSPVCNQGYQLDGELGDISDGIRTCMNDSTWDGTILKCILVECSIELLKPDDNFYEFEGSNEVMVKYNVKVTAKCKDGYEYVNGNLERTCLGNMSFSGEEPVCAEKSCDFPVSIPNVRYSDILNKTYPLDSVLTWSCDEGYTSEQNKSRVCLPSSSWSNEEPLCTMITCPFLENLNHGSLKLSNGSDVQLENIPYKTTVEVVCEKGFIPNVANILCTSNGTWDTLPECTDIQCEGLGQLTGGYYSYSNASDQVVGAMYVYGTTAESVCNETLFRATEGQMVCDLDGTWEGNRSSCIPLCEAPPLENGYYRGTDGANLTEYTEGQTATPVCNEGYHLEGQSTDTPSVSRTCQTNHTWEGQTPSCKRKECISPSIIDNGEYSKSLNQTFAVGAILTWSCSEGYTSTQNKSRTCLPTSNWSDDEPICTIITCPVFKDFTNGILKHTNGSEILSEQIPSMTSLNIVCHKTFKSLFSNATCTLNGTWDTVPKCLPIQCKGLGVLTEGHYMYNNTPIQDTDDMYPYGTVATAVCNATSFKGTEGGLTCGDEGTWAGNKSACVPLCTVPVIENGHYEGQNNTNLTEYEVGQAITPVCNEGFRLDRNINEAEIISRTCLIDQNWDGSNISCLEVQCETESLQPDGNFYELDEPRPPFVRYNNSISAKCKHGYEPVSGDRERSCLANKSLSGEELVCTVVTCSVASLRKDENFYQLNGSVVSSVTYNETIAAHCKDGYEHVSGDFERKCLLDKTFTGNELVCSAKQNNGTARNSYLIAAIAGGSAIGLLSFGLCGVIAFWVLKRRRKADMNKSISSMNFAYTNPVYRKFSEPPMIDDTPGRFSDLSAVLLGSDAASAGFSNDLQVYPHGMVLPYHAIPGSKSKTRYRNLYAFTDDETTIVLKVWDEETDTEYDNACYIHGFQKPTAYIVSQGSEADIWRMAWQTRCVKVVMLSSIGETAKIYSGNHLPPEGRTVYHGSIKVTAVNTQTYTNIVIRTLMISKVGEAQRRVFQFQLTSWPDGDVASFSSTLLHFRYTGKAAAAASGGPTIVHCRSDIDRAGTFIAIDYLIDMSQALGFVDATGWVETLRRQRVNMVLTQEQCSFLQEVVTAYHRQQDTYSNFT